MKTLLLALSLAWSGASVQAQVAPSAAEAAAYTGLHMAAHKGDVAKIQRLVATGTSLNTTDGHGRTPLHIATFAGQREAVRALVKAGADLNKLENDRYDAVTVASVADDEETLEGLAATGCQREADHQPLRRHSPDRGSAPGSRRCGAPTHCGRGATRPCEQPALDRRDRVDRAWGWWCAASGDAEGLDRCRGESAAGGSQWSDAAWRWRRLVGTRPWFRCWRRLGRVEALFPPALPPWLEGLG